MQRLGSAFMTITGFVLGLALLARLGWLALHGFEPVNDFDRARVADGTYWPIMKLFLASAALAAVVAARIAISCWRLDRQLKQMDREFFLKYGISSQTHRRKQRDRS